MTTEELVSRCCRLARTAGELLNIYGTTWSSGAVSGPSKSERISLLCPHSPLQTQNTSKQAHNTWKHLRLFVPLRWRCTWDPLRMGRTCWDCTTSTLPIRYPTFNYRDRLGLRRGGWLRRRLWQRTSLWASGARTDCPGRRQTKIGGRTRQREANIPRNTRWGWWLLAKTVTILFQAQYSCSPSKCEPSS